MSRDYRESICARTVLCTYCTRTYQHIFLYMSTSTSTSTAYPRYIADEVYIRSLKIDDHMTHVVIGGYDVPPYLNLLAG